MIVKAAIIGAILGGISGTWVSGTKTAEALVVEAVS